MRFKDYIEIVGSPTQPSTNVPAPQPPAATNQPDAPGTVQQGQQQLPPGTENEDWYKQIMKSRMPPEWQQHFIQARLFAGNNMPSTGQMMLRNMGHQAMQKMIGHDPFGGGGQ